MKYSKALIESLEAAQLLAGHFTTDYLESWHLLIALANNPYSVAGSVLNEFPVEVDGFEEAAFQITGQAYQKDGHFELLPFSYRLEELFEEAGPWLLVFWNLPALATRTRSRDRKLVICERSWSSELAGARKISRLFAV